MTRTQLSNPFGSPILHVPDTDSTMREARSLAAGGEIDGTVVYADFQRSGRGRIDGRTWQSAPRESLLCTVILKRLPAAGFTLRVGLAVARTFDTFLPTGRETRIKWPNDVLFEGKKLSGILCENDGSALYVGTGLNIAQTVFPADLESKATSLARILAAVDTDSGTALPTVEEMLVRYLDNLKDVLAMGDWQERVAAKLYRLGEPIRFLSGDPEKREYIEGAITGIGERGELLFRPTNAAESGVTAADGLLHLFSGEIPYAE